MMGKDDITLCIAILGAVTGIVGLILSVMNTWRAFDRDRVKLKVQARCAIISRPIGGTNDLLCVEVTNVGFVPVTVSQVGFNLRKPRKHFLAFIPEQGISDPLPKRLEPRTSMTIFVPNHVSSEDQFGFVTTAFAKTQCGESFTSGSKALKSYVKRAHS